MKESTSEWQKAWRRFRRNWPAFIALWYIVAAVLIALLGYLLAPDHSPDANTQIPEIALQSPGYEAELLPVYLNRELPPSSWLTSIFKGEESPVRYIAVVSGSLELREEKVFFERLGARIRSELPLVQLYHVVGDSLKRDGDILSWKNATKGSKQVSLAALTAQFESQKPIIKRTFWLGTDKYGRCMLSRLLLGFRVSLVVGCIAVFISLTIGLFMGALGGYVGGRTDDIVMLVVNTVWSIPTLLLVFAIVLALGRGVGIIFFAVGLTMWVDVARVVRGQVLALRGMQFVEAAKGMGFGSGRILGPVLVVAAGNFATAILLESGLSYLGFGVQPPTPSWGGMLNENYGYALGGKPVLALVPALAIALTVLAFNMIGNGLRDALDVKG
jgi:peptide/nickel transport system permease protein